MAWENIHLRVDQTFLYPWSPASTRFVTRFHGCAARNMLLRMACDRFRSTYKYVSSTFHFKISITCRYCHSITLERCPKSWWIWKWYLKNNATLAHVLADQQQTIHNITRRLAVPLSRMRRRSLVHVSCNLAANPNSRILPSFRSNNYLEVTVDLQDNRAILTTDTNRHQGNCSSLLNVLRE